mmetsp:Transcript_15578/g.31884  ORF Transcript_15578/g.31884 Transcript_15578/m.31884 type:complete len:305 (-) Transcript_15578:381-1295(-)
MSSGGVRSCAAQCLLVLINLIFLAAGILFTVYAVGMNDSELLEAIGEETGWARHIMQGCLVALGSVIIVLSLLGCYGAFFKKRGLLFCYSFFLVLASILVAVVMAGSFTSMNLVDYWAKEEYPATNQEPFVAKNFNKLYCSAGGAYLCTAAPMVDVITSLVPNITEEIIEFAQDTNGTSSLCNKLDLVNVTIPDQLTHICEECKNVDKNEVFQPVLEWFDGHCPIAEAGSEVLQWCGEYLFQDKTGEEFDGAPYGTCRISYLALWSDTSKTLSYGLLGFFIFLVVVVVAMCFLRRKSEEKSLPY